MCTASRIVWLAREELESVARLCIYEQRAMQAVRATHAVQGRMQC